MTSLFPQYTIEVVIGALVMLLGGFSALAWVRWRYKFEEGGEKRDLAD